MARKSTSGGSDRSDSSYNARRRYMRSAQRYLDKASGMTGETAAKNMRLARIEFDKAMKTYDLGTKQKISAPMQRIADKLGINAQQERQSRYEYFTQGENEDRKEFYEKVQKRAVDESTDSLLNIDDEKLREIEAKKLMSSEVGKRIIAGTEDIWRKKATEEYIDEDGNKHTRVNRDKIYESLFEHYNVDNLADLIDKIEEAVGASLYVQDDYETYRQVALTISGSNAK